MSKKLFAMLALVLALCLAFAACGAPAATNEDENQEEQQQPDAVEENVEDEVVGDEPEAAAFVPGTYTASAQGFGGSVTVTLTLADDGSIASIEVDAPGETPGIGFDAAPVYAESIVTAQSLGADAVSGATFTCTGIKDAVTDCLTQANALDLFAAAE